MRAPTVLATLIFAGVASWAPATRGQSPSVSEQMLAQSLFEEGRQLMARDKYAEACPKLSESQRLDPGGGTLLNLAICHEKEGRVGSAYLEMNSALAQAIKDGRHDREKIANEHLALLGSRIPRLAVHVVREDPGLEVKVDGTLLRKPAWDLLTVVDPGTHVIEASVPGMAPFRHTIVLAEGTQQTVTIPALDVADGQGLSSPPIAATTSTSRAEPETKTNPWFVASVAATVAGFVVALPAGYVWGMTTLLSTACRPEVSSSAFCTSDGVRDRWFAVAAIGLSVGVAGTIGLVAFPRKIQVAPNATSNGAGAVVMGQF